MKTRIVVVGILALTGCGELQPKAGASPPASMKPEKPVYVGRYTIIHSPHLERDTMLLDTSTGKTWQLAVIDKQEDMGWVQIHRLVPADEATTPATSKEKIVQADKSGKQLNQ